MLEREIRLETEDFGKTFTKGGKTFTICGCNPRARKMPIHAKLANGQTYKFDEGVVNLLHPGRMTRTPFGWMRSETMSAHRAAANVGVNGEL